jgi:large conductance mechanosensitive channel
MSMMKEFREFAMRGNVIDMAVGIVIGVAFGGIVTSFVNDVLTPPLGLLLGGVDFTSLTLVLKAAQGETPAVTLNWGMFIQKIIDFIIIAFAIFLVVKAMNSMKKPVVQEAAPPPAQEVLLGEIRDLLKQKS